MSLMSKSAGPKTDYSFMPMNCGKKFCPTCMMHWSDQLKVRALNVVTEIPANHLRHVVLTITNPQKGELRKGVSALLHCFREWRKQGRKVKYGPFWESSRVLGTLWKMELHWSQKTGWHPHLHVVVHTKQGLQMERDSPARALWSRLTEEEGFPASIENGIYVSKPKTAEQAADELAKYAAKPIPIKNLTSDQLREICSGTTDRRWHGSSGTLKLESMTENGTGMFKPVGTISTIVNRQFGDPRGRGSPEEQDMDWQVIMSFRDWLHEHGTEAQLRRYSVLVDRTKIKSTTGGTASNENDKHEKL